jgi:FkbM family methyltransferase
MVNEVEERNQTFMSQPPSETIRLRARFFGIKRLIAGIMCHPLVGRLISIVFRNRIPSRGCVINTDCEAVTPSLKAALFWGLYESSEVRFVKEYLRNDLDVIELGSSLGVVSCQILRKLKPGLRLVCVEANPHLLKTLRQNLEQQSSGHDVTVVHGAVANPSSDNSSVHFALAVDSTASHVASDDGPLEAVSVPALTLSEILRANHIDRSFSLVSDIEGAETSFIESDDVALRRCEQILIELHETSLDGKAISVDRLRQRLEEAHGFILRHSYGPVCLFERVSC